MQLMATGVARENDTEIFEIAALNLTTTRTDLEHLAGAQEQVANTLR